MLKGRTENAVKNRYNSVSFKRWRDAVEGCLGLTGHEQQELAHRNSSKDLDFPTHFSVSVSSTALASVQPNSSQPQHKAECAAAATLSNSIIAGADPTFQKSGDIGSENDDNFPSAHATRHGSTMNDDEGGKDDDCMRGESAASDDDDQEEKKRMPHCVPCKRTRVDSCAPWGNAERHQQHDLLTACALPSPSSCSASDRSDSCGSADTSHSTATSSSREEGEDLPVRGQVGDQQHGLGSDGGRLEEGLSVSKGDEPLSHPFDELDEVGPIHDSETPRSPLDDRQRDHSPHESSGPEQRATPPMEVLRRQLMAVRRQRVELEAREERLRATIERLEQRHRAGGHFGRTFPCGSQGKILEDNKQGKDNLSTSSSSALTSESLFVQTA